MVPIALEVNARASTIRGSCGARRAADARATHQGTARVAAVPAVRGVRANIDARAGTCRLGDAAAAASCRADLRRETGRGAPAAVKGIRSGVHARFVAIRQPRRAHASIGSNVILGIDRQAVGLATVDFDGAMTQRASTEENCDERERPAAHGAIFSRFAIGSFDRVPREASRMSPIGYGPNEEGVDGAGRFVGRLERGEVRRGIDALDLEAWRRSGKRLLRTEVRVVLRLRIGGSPR